MTNVLKYSSFAGLGLMLGSSILVFNGVMGTPLYYDLCIVGTAVWFGTVPFWMQRRLHGHGKTTQTSAP